MLWCCDAALYVVLMLFMAGLVFVGFPRPFSVERLSVSIEIVFCGGGVSAMYTSAFSMARASASKFEV